jgi:hypothetical protein
LLYTSVPLFFSFSSLQVNLRETEGLGRGREKRERLTTGGRGNFLDAGPSGNREEGWIKNRERAAESLLLC